MPRPVRQREQVDRRSRRPARADGGPRAPGLRPGRGDRAARGLALRARRRRPCGAVAFLRDAVAPGSYLTISHIGTEFFPDKAAMGEAKAVYERASEPIWARSRNQVLGFFDGFELLEPGLVPERLWRSVTGPGQAATGTPDIQRDAVGRKPRACPGTQAALG